MNISTLLRHQLVDLINETEYLGLVLRGKDIPGFIIMAIQLVIDIGFIFGNGGKDLFDFCHWSFPFMNAGILGLYFWSKRDYNENFLLYRWLLRVAVLSLVIWMVKVKLSVP